ncbi:MAG TPA: hypothetical protein VNC50_06580, partial [Planctomycetia bacterium]|nr:hypothetical protein [Planctomycetia bacterium]
IRTYDAATGREMGVADGSTHEWLAFAPGSAEAWFSDAGVLKSLDAATGTARTVAPIDVDRLKFAPDGTALAVVDKKSFLIQKGELTPGPDSSRGDLNIAALAPKGRWALGSLAHKSAIWDGATRTWAAQANAIHELAATPDGRTLAATTYAGEIVVWDRVTGRVRARFEGPSPYRPNPRTLSLAADGERLIAGGEIYDLGAGKGRGEKNALALLADGRGIIALGKRTKRETIEVRRTGVPAPAKLEGTSENHQILRALAAPDGRLLAHAWYETHGKFGTSGASVRLTELRTGAAWSTPMQAEDLAFSREGAMLAACDWHRRCLWACAPFPGARVARIEALPQRSIGDFSWPHLSGLCFVDGGVAFVDEDDHALQVADIGTGRITKSLTAAQAGSGITSAAALDGGKRIATGQGDGSILIWEVATLPAVPVPAQIAAPRLDTDGDPLPTAALRRIGSRRFRLPAEKRELAILSPDGKRIACVTNREYLLLDIASGQRLRS